MSYRLSLQVIVLQLSIIHLDPLNSFISNNLQAISSNAPLTLMQIKITLLPYRCFAKAFHTPHLMPSIAYSLTNSSAPPQLSDIHSSALNGIFVKIPLDSKTFLTVDMQLIICFSTPDAVLNRFEIILENFERLVSDSPLEFTPLRPKLHIFPVIEAFICPRLDFKHLI